MTEKWYDGLNDDAFLSKENKSYKAIIDQIIDTVKSGMGFDEACETVVIENPELRSSAVEDALKVLLADLYFTQKLPVDQIAEKLKIPAERISAAIQSMINEVKDDSVRAFYGSLQ